MSPLVVPLWGKPSSEASVKNPGANDAALTRLLCQILSQKSEVLWNDEARINEKKRGRLPNPLLMPISYLSLESRPAVICVFARGISCIAYVSFGRAFITGPPEKNTGLTAGCEQTVATAVDRANPEYLLT